MKQCAHNYGDEFQCHIYTNQELCSYHRAPEAEQEKWFDTPKDMPSIPELHEQIKKLEARIADLESQDRNFRCRWFDGPEPSDGRCRVIVDDRMALCAEHMRVLHAPLVGKRCPDCKNSSLLLTDQPRTATTDFRCLTEDCFRAGDVSELLERL